MRLWSVHPKYLDTKGLVALWREGLLAQKVLLGQTKGYTQHPQLTRFKQQKNVLGAIASYLREVQDEATKRGYQFDRTKIVNRRFQSKIAVTSGQLEFEVLHLRRKLLIRDPSRLAALEDLATIKTHPLFTTKKGGVESWEIIE